MENSNQTSIPQSQSITQVAPQSAPTTNLYKYLFFGLLTLVLMGGSVFVGNRISNKQVTTPPPQVVTVLPTSNPTLAIVSATPTLPEASPTSDVTSTWKTYTASSEIVFSVKYPPTWSVKTQNAMNGGKFTNLNSGDERIGGVSVQWGENHQPVEPNCNTESAKKVMVQIKNQKIEMCHMPGSPHEPEAYSYNASQEGINYSIVTSNYPGEKNRDIILKVLSTLEL